MMKKLTQLSIIIIWYAICSTSFAQVIKGTYAIKNVQTGMLLRIKDADKKDGTPLVAYSPVNWKCMTWDFKHVKGQTYQLKNLFTSKTFQYKSLVASNGVSLEQRPINNNEPGQQYEFIPIEKDSYLIRLKEKDLYLTPSDSKGAINSAIILAEKSNSKLQRWTIYEQHPEI
ncbi:MAG TPA: RICIN domain-containing protein [Chitinophagaceae bacterium]|nr:RICIN domain-containing protein [Chitinophagaceae bacterium]